MTATANTWLGEGKKTLTVKELINRLSTFPQELPVVACVESKATAILPTHVMIEEYGDGPIVVVNVDR